MIVTLEQLLDAWSLKLSLMYLHLLSIGIFPLTIRIFGVKVIFFGRGHERGLHAFLDESRPVKVCEPIVLLEHVGTLFAETVCSLSLD